MSGRVTIDDLGIDKSVRYAHDQSVFDEAILKESSLVSGKTTIDITKPCYSSEFELLFQIGKRFRPWADFFSPLGYNVSRASIFSYNLIPSLGSEDLRLRQMEKIQAEIENAKKRRRKERRGEEGLGWEQQKEEEDEKKESEALLLLFDFIQKLDQALSSINARRNQYQRG